MTDEEKAALAKEEADKKAAEDHSNDEKKKAEEVRNELKKDQEKSKLTDTEAAALKDLMKWKDKARELESTVKEFQTKYADVDVEAARAALKAKEEAENKDLERKGEYDRLLAKQKEAAEAKINSIVTEKSELEKRIEEMANQVNMLTLGNAFANSRYIAENLALTPNKTQALYSSHFEIEDGQLVAYDAPKGSPNRTKIIDARGEPVSFEQAIETIINSDPDKDYLIKATLKSGAGSKTTTTTGNDKPKFESTLEKLAAGVKNPKNFGYGEK